MSKRSQRYKLTAEFVLKDRGDYLTYRKLFETFFRGLDSPNDFQSDYLSIEKVEDERPNQI